MADVIPGQTVIYAGNPGDLAQAADIIEAHIEYEVLDGCNADDPDCQEAAFEMRMLVARLRAAE